MNLRDNGAADEYRSGFLDSTLKIDGKESGSYNLRMKTIKKRAWL